MHILVSNDDGVQARGIKCLQQALRATDNKITVIAPDRNRSGSGCAMTLRQPLYPTKIDDDVIQLDGTPVDCVHIALTGYLPQLPDCVISGINHGANLGDDVPYSGTVGAALEGRHLDKPALAVSLVGDQHFDSAARVTVDLLEWLQKQQLASSSVLNVNVPDLPYEQIRGWRVTRLGTRALGHKLTIEHKPRADKDSLSDTRELRPSDDLRLWIGASGTPIDAFSGTDFHAISNGYVSITPLKVDLTRHAQTDDLAALL